MADVSPAPVFDASHAAALRVLAALFRAAPGAPQLAPVRAALRERALTRDWPFGDAATLTRIGVAMADGLDRDDGDAAYQRLFIGPLDFEAPPWGSVYLDPESVLFGDSTIELRGFLRRIGASIDTGMNEPEDHIGLMLHLAADLLAAGRLDALRELLALRLLPWSGRYLELLRTHAAQPLYEGLAALTAITLDALAAALDLRAAPRALSR